MKHLLVATAVAMCMMSCDLQSTSERVLRQYERDMMQENMDAQAHQAYVDSINQAAVREDSAWYAEYQYRLMNEPVPLYWTVSCETCNAAANGVASMSINEQGEFKQSLVEVYSSQWNVHEADIAVVMTAHVSYLVDLFRD